MTTATEFAIAQDMYAASIQGADENGTITTPAGELPYAADDGIVHNFTFNELRVLSGCETINYDTVDNYYLFRAEMKADTDTIKSVGVETKEAEDLVLDTTTMTKALQYKIDADDYTHFQYFEAYKAGDAVGYTA